MDEIEAEERGDAAVGVAEGSPGDGDFAAPVGVFDDGLVADAGRFQGLPRVGVASRVELALGKLM